MPDPEQIEPEDVDGCGGNVLDSATAEDESRNRCSNMTIRYVFSSTGLVVLVILYCLLGAFIFPLLEAKVGAEQLHQGAPSGLTLSISKSREDCLRELWTITGKFY